MYITERFSLNSGHAVQFSKLIKEVWPTVLQQEFLHNYFLKATYITKIDIGISYMARYVVLTELHKRT